MRTLSSGFTRPTTVTSSSPTESVPDSSVTVTKITSVLPDSNNATSGYVLTADGSGGVNWSIVNAGELGATVTNDEIQSIDVGNGNANITAGYVLSADGAGGTDWVEAGSSDFVTLSDTPGSLSGQGGKFVAVNTGATALEFVDAPTGGLGVSSQLITETVTYDVHDWSTGVTPGAILQTSSFFDATPKMVKTSETSGFLLGDDSGKLLEIEYFTFDGTSLNVLTTNHIPSDYSFLRKNTNDTPTIAVVDEKTILVLGTQNPSASLLVIVIGLTSDYNGNKSIGIIDTISIPSDHIVSKPFGAICKWEGNTYKIAALNEITDNTIDIWTLEYSPVGYSLYKANNTVISGIPNQYFSNMFTTPSLDRVGNYLLLGHSNSTSATDRSYKVIELDSDGFVVNHVTTSVFTGSVSGQYHVVPLTDTTFVGTVHDKQTLTNSSVTGDLYCKLWSINTSTLAITEEASVKINDVVGMTYDAAGGNMFVKDGNYLLFVNETLVDGTGTWGTKMQSLEISGTSLINLTDLTTFGTDDNWQHTGIYAGSGKILHFCTSGDNKGYRYITADAVASGTREETFDRGSLNAGGTSNATAIVNISTNTFLYPNTTVFGGLAANRTFTLPEKALLGDTIELYVYYLLSSYNLTVNNGLGRINNSTNNVTFSGSDYYPWLYVKLLYVGPISGGADWGWTYTTSTADFSNLASATHTHTSTDISSDAATNGQVLTADGAGGVAWEEAGGFTGSYTGDVLFEGTYTGTASVPATGAGTRMMFDPESGSFRAGRVTGTQWDNSNIGVASAAFGYNVTASGIHSATFNSNTTASNYYAFASGQNTTASGYASAAFGKDTISSAGYTFACGSDTNAGGDFAFATGGSTTASGTHSATFNSNTTASGDYAFASGGNTTASGHTSAAFGTNTTASGYTSVAFGEQTKANAQGDFVIGRYNIGGGDGTYWADTDPLFEIGNGTANLSRSNAFTVLKNGDTTIGGGLFVTTPKTPATAADTGTVGQIAWDTDYIYICVATNTWKRAAIATW